ncbi:MAG: hypothetical protein KJ621_14580, partial [Proteobacteria bacterium]|nr:hypothetical protein [Pseudomonadota bacterium]
MARLMDGQKADMVLTDPPYGMNLDTDWSGISGAIGSIGKRNKTSGHKHRAVIGDDVDFDPAPLMRAFDETKEQFWFGADYYAERIPSRNDGAWLVWDK